jgi:hypothetical protein
MGGDTLVAVIAQPSPRTVADVLSGEGHALVELKVAASDMIPCRHARGDVDIISPPSTAKS